MNINYAKLAEFCEAYKVNYNVLCMYVREAVAIQPPSYGEVRAWMRRWAFDGVDVMALPKKERPRGWQLRDVTEAKCLDDDVPLYTAPPSAPVGVEGVRRYLAALNPTAAQENDACHHINTVRGEDGVRWCQCCRQQLGQENDDA